MGKLITSSGSITDVFPTSRGRFTLKELQTLVGGFIEIIETNNPLFVLVINEDGKAMRLPRNETAMRMTTEIGLHPTDFLVGDVVIGTRLEMGINDDEAEP